MKLERWYRVLVVGAVVGSAGCAMPAEQPQADSSAATDASDAAPMVSADAATAAETGPQGRACPWAGADPCFC